MSKTVEEMARELAEVEDCPEPEKHRKDCPMDSDYNKIECWQCWLLYPAEITAKYAELVKQKGAEDE